MQFSTQTIYNDDRMQFMLRLMWEKLQDEKCDMACFTYHWNKERKMNKALAERFITPFYENKINFYKTSWTKSLLPVKFYSSRHIVVYIFMILQSIEKMFSKSVILQHFCMLSIDLHHILYGLKMYVSYWRH